MASGAQRNPVSVLVARVLRPSFPTTLQAASSEREGTGGRQPLSQQPRSLHRSNDRERNITALRHTTLRS